MRDYGDRIVIQVKPRGESRPHCIKCGADITSHMCYTGKVLRGFSWLERDVVMKDPNTHTIDEVTKRVPVTQYERGYICDTCSADYSTVVDNRGERIPVVVTDSRLVNPRDDRVGFKSHKGFNTRYTR